MPVKCFLKIFVSLLVCSQFFQKLCFALSVAKVAKHDIGLAPPALCLISGINRPTILFCNQLIMPNWNYNNVTIGAPINEVKKYLVFKKEDKSSMFNMHLLYPEVFSKKDKTWEKGWDYSWAIEHTDSKWFPEIVYVAALGDDMTVLAYDTARWPNNKLLEKLHDLTGWYILNEYEEPGMEFEGLFVCQENYCTDYRGTYRPVCEVCEKKQPPDLIDYDTEDFLICKTCLAAKS